MLIAMLKHLANVNAIEIVNEDVVVVEVGKEGLGEKPIKSDFDQIGEIFNAVCANLPKVTKITKARESAISAREKEYGFEKIGAVFKMVSESRFLNGENQQAWRADFDWVMNPNNFIKILEGKYQNNENKSRSQNQPKSDADHRQDAVDAVAKLLGRQ
jgi:hypothetical protein